MPATTEHYDELEARPAELRHQAQMAALSRQIANARDHAPAFAASLAGIDPAAIRDRGALQTLPVLRKHELLAQQRRPGAPDVFGGCSTLGWGTVQAQRRALRVFASPGPLFEPEGAAPDYWRMARALHAAGLRPGDLVHNCFSYHFVPAGSMMEGGALALGCTVFPGGTGQTEQQAATMAALAPNAYMGTPSFLKLILDKADETGLPLPSLKKASVGGEALPPSLRAWLLDRGIETCQSYGTADLGLIAYETRAHEGLVIDEGVIVEIVRPGTGEALPDGEVGEVVVTTLNPDYPLIRFGTGDLSAVLAGTCPTGRTNTRLRGWLGRADQTSKVRGLFVHPEQVAEIVRQHPAVRKARLVIAGDMAADTMTLVVEVDGQPAGLAERLTDALRQWTRLRGEVSMVAPGSLPNDGKVIEDARSHR